MENRIVSLMFEGGGIDIFQIEENCKILYQVNHDEMDVSEEIGGISKKKKYYTFETAFHYIQKKFQWYNFVLLVDDEYIPYIRQELLHSLNLNGVSPDQFRQKRALESTLGINLTFGNSPITTSTQIITIYPLIKQTKFIHGRTAKNWNADIIEDDFNLIFEKHEFWDEMTDHFAIKSFETKGKLEINGSAYIIKDEFNLIKFAMPIEKYTISAKPILSESLSWYYTLN